MSLAHAYTQSLYYYYLSEFAAGDNNFLSSCTSGTFLTLTNMNTINNNKWFKNIYILIK